MDYHGLVATNLLPARRPAPMHAEAEDRYYREHARISDLPLGAAIAAAVAALWARAARRRAVQRPPVQS